MAHDSLSQKLQAMIHWGKAISALHSKRDLLPSYQRGATNALRLFHPGQDGNQYDVSTASASSELHAQQNEVPQIGDPLTTQCR